MARIFDIWLIGQQKMSTYHQFLILGLVIKFVRNNSGRLKRQYDETEPETKKWGSLR